MIIFNKLDPQIKSFYCWWQFMSSKVKIVCVILQIIQNLRINVLPIKMKESIDETRLIKRLKGILYLCTLLKDNHNGLYNQFDIRSYLCELKLIQIRRSYIRQLLHCHVRLWQEVLQQLLNIAHKLFNDHFLLRNLLSQWNVFTRAWRRFAFDHIVQNLKWV